jgi:hypothetical protein
VPSRRRKLAPALSSPPKQKEPSNRPGTNHLNPTGTSESCGRTSDDAIDQATADQRLANGDVRGPLWAVGQEITDGNRQVVVRIHQAGSGRNDSVTIRIRIIREGYLVFVFQAHQSRHGVGAGAIHANFAVVIHGHEGKSGVDNGIGDGDIQAVNRINVLPVRPGGSAERIDAEFEVSAANGLGVDDVAQVIHVGKDEILLMGGDGFDGRIEWSALHFLISAVKQVVGAILNPGGDIGIRRPAVWRVVLETAVSRRIVRRSDDDAVGKMIFAAAIVDQNDARNNGRGSDSIIALNDGLHVVGG